DALAVEQRAVAGVEVGDAEVKLVVVLDADHRMAAADRIVALQVKGDGGFRIAAERDFLQAGKIELVDLVDLGSAEMADHNSRSGFRHGVPQKKPACPSEATLLEMRRFSTAMTVPPRRRRLKFTSVFSLLKRRTAADEGESHAVPERISVNSSAMSIMTAWPHGTSGCNGASIPRPA